MGRFAGAGRRSTAGWLWLGAALVHGGCTGAIGDAAAPGADGAGDPDAPVPLAEDGLPAHLRHSPGVRLLTRQELVQSVAQVLGVEVAEEEVPLENVVAGHGHIALEQGVTLDELEAYYDLALTAATDAVAAAGCDERACAEPWAEGVLRRAFRVTALDPEVRAEYLAILDDPGAGADVRDRSVTLVTAALTSPHFLYRTEIGVGDVDDGTRRLAPEELASRLSYLLWQAGPDAELLAAAAAGDLDNPAGRLAWLETMLEDRRARVGLRGFVYDWMDLAAGGGIPTKDPEVLAGTTAALPELAREGLDRMVDDVLWEGAGTLPALLGTERFHVRGELAELLGMGAGPSAFEARRVDPAERLGVLMHPAVVAAHTKESGASPFNLGKFLYEQMLCETIGAPPVIPDFPEGDGETLRQTLEAVTASPGCQTCHAKIGPPGFAFLTMDPIGRYLPTDGAGRPWDTAGTVPVGAGDTVTFASAPDLVAQLAEHPATARCVARRIYRWTFGHFEPAADGALVAGFEDASVGSGGDARDLLRAVVGSEAFTRVRVAPPADGAE